MATAVDDLEAEIQRLDDLGLDELRKLCGLMLGAVALNHGAHLLRRRLAYALQAKVLADLSAATQRRLQRLQHFASGTGRASASNAARHDARATSARGERSVERCGARARTRFR